MERNWQSMPVGSFNQPHEEGRRPTASSLGSQRNQAIPFLLVGAKPANLLPGLTAEDAATGKGGQGGKSNHMPIWNMTCG